MASAERISLLRVGLRFRIESCRCSFAPTAVRVVILSILQGNHAFLHFSNRGCTSRWSFPFSHTETPCRIMASRKLPGEFSTLHSELSVPKSALPDRSV